MTAYPEIAEIFSAIENPLLTEREARILAMMRGLTASECEVLLRECAEVVRKLRSKRHAELPISRVGFSSITEDRLYRAGISTLGALLKLSRRALGNKRLIGEATLNEIERVLADLGLQLAPARSDG